MPGLKAQIVVKTELTFSDDLYPWIEPHLHHLTDRRPSENIFSVSRSVVAGAEVLLETFDFYRHAVTSALGIDPKSCVEDVVEAIQKFNLTIKDGQLYKNGELVTRGDDDDPQVVDQSVICDEANDEVTVPPEWSTVTTATDGIVAFCFREDDACLFAQLLKVSS